MFLFLFGGPSQIDLWDMKPEAPDNVRGEFTPTKTVVPGVHVCEHPPGLGKGLDKVRLLRSMTHWMNVHGPACSEVFSGRPHFMAPITDQASREDWPSLSSMVARYGRAGAVRGGRASGATTRAAGYVTEDPVTPADLSATILRHLGIDHRREYDDEFQRLRHRLSDGEPVRDLN